MGRLVLWGLLGWTGLASAQSLPTGLYEGMMGNSGVAISESMAPSAYNPSLLRHRQANSVSVGGNALGTYSSQSANTNTGAVALTPTYLSTITPGQSLVHEFFFQTFFSGALEVEMTAPNTVTNLNTNILRQRFGYSMAFKSIPLALQFLGRYSDSQATGFSEFIDTSSNIVTSSHLQSENKYLGTSLGISTHMVQGSYTLGVNFLTRSVKLFEEKNGLKRSFVNNNGTSTIEEREGVFAQAFETGYQLSIGHGFKVGKHEFLTDSNLVETTALSHTYDFTQSFGYRLSGASGHQFLCGLNHMLGPDITYFGQALHTTAGYSWLTRALRSTFGLYYASRELSNQTTRIFGVTFGSEFQY